MNKCELSYSLKNKTLFRLYLCQKVSDNIKQKTLFASYESVKRSKSEIMAKIFLQSIKQKLQ